MANTLGNYNPIFYAQEALIQLDKALGMAMRVHRGYDAERAAFGKGDTINITRPGYFVSAAAPVSTPSDLTPENVAIVLNSWQEVKFALTDKELAYTKEKIIDDHIAPAARAIATKIDTDLNALYADVPWGSIISAIGSPVVGDVITPRKILFDNKVPLDPGFIHYELDGALEADLLSLSAFTQQQGSGDPGVTAQRTGSLGMKFGVEPFANQNVPTHTSGDVASTGTALAVVGATLKGATTITLDAVSATGTLKKGDSFVIAGNTQRYAIMADNLAAANTFTGVTFTPPLAANAADNAVVTYNVQGSLVKAQNLMFHRNAFALGMAKLPDVLISQMGAKVASIADPITGLALRSRMFYDGNNSKVIVALDVLYGVKTLDPNLAVRVARG